MMSKVFVVGTEEEQKRECWAQLKSSSTLNEPGHVLTLLLCSCCVCVPCRTSCPAAVEPDIVSSSVHTDLGPKFQLLSVPPPPPPMFLLLCAFG